LNSSGDHGAARADLHAQFAEAVRAVSPVVAMPQAIRCRRTGAPS
jgi:hypothetical protein